MKRAFRKMHGCGNDYIYFNCFDTSIDDPEAVSRRLSDRHFSIGGDGIILILPSEVADGKMRIFNADGSEAKMCGNGIRCVGKYLYDNHLVTKKTFTVDTLSGIKTLTIEDHSEDKSYLTVDMGAAILEPERIPVNKEGDSVIKESLVVGEKMYEVTCVSMGNPHCVVLVEDVASLELEKIGPLFEKHEAFPEGINTEFIQAVDDTTLKMRVWERGSGETFACGTGACAAVVAATLNGICPKGEKVTVQLVGGNLDITYTDETVYMTGEAVNVFDGEVEL